MVTRTHTPQRDVAERDAYVKRHLSDRMKQEKGSKRLRKKKAQRFLQRKITLLQRRLRNARIVAKMLHPIRVGYRHRPLRPF